MLSRVGALTIALLAVAPAARLAQVASWLDEPKPASWNRPAAPIPRAPTLRDTNTDPRCKEMARPAETAPDRRVRERGWQLVGAYEGGWEILVIRATAGYDGMCRPRAYQGFVFVRGMFAGTLSPQPMESRGDGAVGQVFIQDGNRVVAEYLRYAASDPLCCPSRTTTVVFEVGKEMPVVRPVSVSTSRR